MARVIKKYANRKLYDTKAKRYLTLNDVAKLVQQGEDIQVIDNSTKQDVTSVVLSGIILDSAKREKSILPDAMLVDIIQQRGEAAVAALRKSVEAGVGAAEVVQQEVEKRLKQAIEAGREQADTASAIVESVGAMFKEFVGQMPTKVEQVVEERLAQLLSSMNIPTRQEIKQLEASVELLTRQVEQLVLKKGPPKTKKKKASGKAKRAKPAPGRGRKK